MFQLPLRLDVSRVVDDEAMNAKARTLNSGLLPRQLYALAPFLAALITQRLGTAA